MNVWFHTTRSDRKIIDRVMRSEETFEVTVSASENSLLWPAPTESNDNACERGGLVQVQDVDALASRGIIQLWFEQHATGSQKYGQSTRLVSKVWIAVGATLRVQPREKAHREVEGNQATMTAHDPCGCR